MGRPFLKERFPGPTAPLSTDILIALLPPGNHFWNQFRRILQIGIHNNRRIARQIIDASNHSDFLAEIARQIDIRYATVLFMKLPHNIQRMIPAAIIDEHELEIIPRYTVNDLYRTPVKFMKNCFFVITRY